MIIQLLSFLEIAAFTTGILLILIALFKYTQRTQDYQSVWRVLINKLKNGFNMTEFKIYRLGISILVFGLVLRLINQIFFPSYW